LEPLKVHCSDSRCEANFHCFGQNRRKKNWQKEYEGQCQACGKKLVDWDRVRRRDLADVAGTFSELAHEWIRHVFFHAEFDEHAKSQAHELGLEGLKSKIRPLLAKKIGPEKIFRDGIQTKKEGSAIHYAQHATATCCRKCLEYWHGIERNRELKKEELDYCEGLVCAYLDLRADELIGDDLREDQAAELKAS
jgi:Domain of unknown function (DUF4186)